MSGSIRLFVTTPLAEGTRVAITPTQARYLAAVMRREPGDSVRLFNGQDGEWDARITELGRGTALLTPVTQLREQRPERDLWLAFALLKRDATDLVAQKATELGASVILPVLTERTMAGHVNLARVSAIAVEAAEQCERLTVPEVRPPQRLAALLSDWPDGRHLFAAMARRAAALPPRVREPAALLIGPEGGFTPAELDGLQSTPFVTPVSLGPLVLRAETAAIAGLALLQADRGDGY